MAVLPPVQAAPSSGAEAQTRALVEAYRSCCRPNGASATCKAVDSFFAYDVLAKKTVAPQAKVLTPRQRQRLETALKQIFEQTAEGSGQAFCQKEPTLAGSKERPDGTEVTLEVLEEGEDVPSSFAFLWRQIDGKWLVQDLLVEGGSLITDYQNQFARIRQKEGTVGLLRRIEARLHRAAGPKPGSAHKERL